MTSQRRHTALASSICRMAGPVFPMGKNSSGSSSRQAARSRQSMLIVLLDEAVGAVRTGTGPVAGRGWLRGAEPVVGAGEGRVTRWGRVVLVVISCMSRQSRVRGRRSWLGVALHGRALAGVLGRLHGRW